eukprot:ANDGO_08563.mRNA.1 hypothetical protein
MPPRKTTKKAATTSKSDSDAAPSASDSSAIMSNGPTDDLGTGTEDVSAAITTTAAPTTSSDKTFEEEMEAEFQDVLAKPILSSSTSAAGSANGRGTKTSETSLAPGSGSSSPPRAPPSGGIGGAGVKRPVTDTHPHDVSGPAAKVSLLTASNSGTAGEDDEAASKRLARAARFGVSAVPSVPAVSAVPKKDPAQSEKEAARAARFGVAEKNQNKSHGQSKDQDQDQDQTAQKTDKKKEETQVIKLAVAKLATDEQKLKRAQRFGVQSAQ